MNVLHGIGIIIIVTFSLIFMAITKKWVSKQDLDYKVINIDEWKEMNIMNMKLKKRKAILERNLINILLEEDYEEETGEKNIVQINY